MSFAEPLPLAEKSRKRPRRSKSPSILTFAVRAPTASHAFSACAIFTQSPSGPPFTWRLPLCAPNTFHGWPSSGVEKSARNATPVLSERSELGKGGPDAADDPAVAPGGAPGAGAPLFASGAEPPQE